MNTTGHMVTLGILINAVCVTADFPPVEELPSRPALPDPLVMLDGTPVTTAERWHSRRRTELLGLFAHYMYGHPPPAPTADQMRFETTDVDQEYFGGRATRKLITIHYGPPAAPPIRLLLVVPNIGKPVPVFAGLNFQGNYALLDDPAIPLPQTWIYGYEGVRDNRATEAGRGRYKDVWMIERVIDRGYAVATAYNGDIDPDVPDFSDGVHPHYYKPGQVAPSLHEWGTIAAWAWGLSRIVDYLVTDSDIDSKRIAVVGHSRLGKTALLAGALDERIALVIPNQAGCGGTAPSRTDNPDAESVRAINDRFPHWFNDVFPRFNAHVDRLPFDQHCLIALVAPRPVLLNNAVEDRWANPDGQFEMLKAADPVYRLLGAQGLATQEMPEPNRLIDSRLGYHIRPGKHAMGPEDWAVFLDFADSYLHVGADTGRTHRE